MPKSYLALLYQMLSILHMYVILVSIWSGDAWLTSQLRELGNKREVSFKTTNQKISPVTTRSMTQPCCSPKQIMSVCKVI